jgi:ABC-type transport system involved in cytochrome c biogenesis permease subunit
MLIPFLAVPMVALLFGEQRFEVFKMLLSAWIPFALVIAAWGVAALVRIVWREAGRRAFAVWEGSLLAPGMVSGPRHASATLPQAVIEESNPLLADVTANKSGLAYVLDGATMLLFELFFIILWTGIIMGAIWADHSWGRPWGWDPKEVFALNTWIIFLILVHVRIKVQDKALWTAVLGVVGCSVMLFNWIVVNFFITGLHSYA